MICHDESLQNDVMNLCCMMGALAIALCLLLYAKNPLDIIDIVYLTSINLCVLTIGFIIGVLSARRAQDKTKTCLINSYGTYPKCEGRTHPSGSLEL